MSGDAGVDGGMSGMAHDVGTAAGSAARDVRDTAGSAGSAATQGAQSAGQTMADAGSAAMGTARDTASSAASDVKQGAAGAAGTASDAAASAASGASSAMGKDGGTAESSQGSLTDGQILAIASATSSAEIAAAKLALKQSKNAKVKEFANMMVKDHTAANRQGMALAKKASLSPEESEVSRQVKQDGEDELAKLQKLKGKAFDTAYVEAQVEDHQKALQAIDAQLLPNAQNGELKSMLTKVRATVAEHLDHAKSLQSNLAGSAK